MHCLASDIVHEGNKLLGVAVFAPLAKRRPSISLLRLSPEMQSTLLLFGLSFIVVAGFLGSIFAPVLFASAFAGVEVDPASLTPFMNGW